MVRSATDRRGYLRSGMAYTAMVADIRRELELGRLKLGDRLASEIGLAEQYGISVTSVRRGIEALVGDGILERRRGSGTYVCCTPAPSSVRFSRRDTVALIWPVALDSYHPYYTELFSALRTTLGQQGWAVWEPELQESTAGTDMHKLAVTPDQVIDVLHQHPELAGLITRDWLVSEGAGARSVSLPVVTSDLAGHFPGVGYRWTDELERGFRELLARGRRRLWCISVFAEERVREASRRAAAALGVAEPELCLKRTSDSILSFSRAIHVAFESAQRDLGDAESPFDGVFAGDDFLAQGVLDALLELGKKIPADLDMAAILNRESRLRGNRPLIELVADGAAVGRAMGQLMHQHIVAPGQAPKQVLLSCELRTYQGN